jgi:hypothetical protein
MLVKIGLHDRALPIPPAIPDAVEIIEFVSFCDISLHFCPMSGGYEYKDVSECGVWMGNSE